MFSSVLSSSMLVAAIILVIHAGRSNSQACNVYVSSTSRCYLSVSVKQPCTSAIFRFPGTNFTKLCDSIDIFWNYPMNNLTLIIDTSYTTKRQSYALQLDGRLLKPQISRLFQLQANGVTAELSLQSDTIAVKSDSNFQVGLKFQGPNRLTYYGVFIRYKVVRT